MSEDDVREELERLRRENEELKAGKSARGLHLKVSQKGAASLYGLRRFPVTFYKDEWLRLLEMGDEIRTFLAEHDAELKGKEGS
jgi:hypothetical protein